MYGKYEDELHPLTRQDNKTNGNKIIKVIKCLNDWIIGCYLFHGGPQGCDFFGREKFEYQQTL